MQRRGLHSLREKCEESYGVNDHHHAIIEVIIDTDILY